MYVGLVLVHGKWEYIVSELGGSTPHLDRAFRFSSELAAQIASEQEGGAGDAEYVEK